MTRLINNMAKVKYSISPNEKGNLLKKTGEFQTPMGRIIDCNMLQ